MSVNTSITVEIAEKETLSINIIDKESFSVNLPTGVHSHPNKHILDGIGEGGGGGDGEYISSVTDGDWKKITNIEFNKVTGKIRIKYNDA